ncbi:MAG: SUMF1/EgtB/PvdO family nonheme iron enzyme [Deltaproteobacteria bacterium]|nr:SUMF1/EgtB/PvdO family nonheme iron enzyme [Deltaproteobacteria bacterium]
MPVAAARCSRPHTSCGALPGLCLAGAALLLGCGDAEPWKCPKGYDWQRPGDPDNYNCVKKEANGSGVGGSSASSSGGDGAQGGSSAQGGSGAQGGAGTCPDDMVPTGVSSVCIDKYEASAGTMSVPGKSPAIKVTKHAAAKKCESVGKRLCAGAEWVSACRGPDKYDFPYGNSFKAGYCNTAADDIAPTGSFPKCVSGYGAFDMSGNVAEWVDECKEDTVPPDDGLLCELMGGSINHQKSAASCTGGFYAVATHPGADFSPFGYRCCRDI